MGQSTKDFVRGMGQALDIGGTIYHIRRIPPVRRSDGNALRSDWSKIGGDFNRAIAKNISASPAVVRTK